MRGSGRLGRDDAGWQFEPAEAWAPGGYRLLIGPELEDLAGNNLRGVFDRDRQAGDTLRESLSGPIRLSFAVAEPEM